MSATDLVGLVCCDLGSIVRGRSLLRGDLDAQRESGVGWVPANHALTPLGPLAEPNPFGSTGDLRLLPDPDTHVRVAAAPGQTPLELLLCDIVETDGRPWECCPRHFLRSALRELAAEFDVHLSASFEHEFQLALDVAPALPFSLEEQRRAEPFATQVMGALLEAGAQPERFFPEYAAHQFEIPVGVAEGLASADRSIVLKEVVREVARRNGLRASFSPLLSPAEAGNGVHIHLSLRDASGAPLLYDPDRPAALSQLGERFAAGILLRARALSALTAASPISATRLTPHRWSAGAVCLAERNREALLRIPPLVSLSSADAASQLHLEYRGADATANPHIALGAIVHAGLEGLRAALPAPPILDRDPAELEESDAARFGVGGLPSSLEDALAALAEDRTARAWMPPLLYDAYLAVKHSELASVSDLDVEEACRRYADDLLRPAGCWSACSPPSSASCRARSSCAIACTPIPSWPTPSSRRPPPLRQSSRSRARSSPAAGGSRASDTTGRARSRCAPSSTGCRCRSAPRLPFERRATPCTRAATTFTWPRSSASHARRTRSQTTCPPRCSRCFSPARRPTHPERSSSPSASSRTSRRARSSPRTFIPSSPGAAWRSTPAA